MNLAYSRLKQLIPHFNERVITPADILGLLAHRDVSYAEIALKQNGYYLVADNMDYVFIKLGLLSCIYHETLAHESIHALIHFPSRSSLRKQQQEADTFALIAIFPLPDINYWLSISGSLEVDEYELLKRRLEVYKRFAI